MSDLKIQLFTRIDRRNVANDTQIELENVYLNEPAFPVVFEDLSSNEQEGLLRVLDFQTFAAEENAIIWEIEQVGKVFDLTSSFVRDNKDTDTRTAITTGQSLIATFEIPGFDVNPSREVVLFYNDDFNPSDLDDLAELGITLTGNGSGFTVSNTTDCRVTFRKPGAVSEVYIINYQPEIMTADA
jgi:hypothetical protein